MTASISKTIKQLVDSESATIDIPTINGQIIRLDCIYKESDSPNFFLVFPPKKLPPDIDTEKQCPVSIKAGQTSLTMAAQIVEIKGDRTLELTAKNTVSPESLRDYFRINVKISITAKYDPESPDSKVPPWTLEGHTLDISGSGILAIFPEEPPTRHRITLLLGINKNQEAMQCIGHVIRTKRLRRGRYQVSFNFDSISSKNKDSLISFCLQEQRNRLRDKIETAN